MYWELYLEVLDRGCRRNTNTLARALRSPVNGYKDRGSNILERMTVADFKRMIPVSGRSGLNIIIIEVGTSHRF